MVVKGNFKSAKEIVEGAIDEVLRRKSEFSSLYELGEFLLDEVYERGCIRDYPDEVVVISGRGVFKVEVRRQRRFDATDACGQSLQGKVMAYVVDEVPYSGEVDKKVEKVKKTKYSWWDLPESLQGAILEELGKYVKLYFSGYCGISKFEDCDIYDFKENSPREDWNNLIRELKSKEEEIF